MTSIITQITSTPNKEKEISGDKSIYFTVECDIDYDVKLDIEIEPKYTKKLQIVEIERVRNKTKKQNRESSRRISQGKESLEW